MVVSAAGEGWSLSVGPRMRDRLWRNLTRERHLVKKSGFCWEVTSPAKIHTVWILAEMMPFRERSFFGMVFDVDMFAAARRAVGNYHRDCPAVVDVEGGCFDGFMGEEEGVGKSGIR